SQAGEVWRIPVRGQPLEFFLSGAGIVRGYEAANGAAAGLDAAAIAARARTGEAAAQAAWRNFGDDLAFLCECVMALLDPKLIVLGGSLTGALDLYRSRLEPRFEGRPTRFVAAELGSAAGVIGAAALNIAG